MNCTKLSREETIHTKLRNCNPQEKKYEDYEKMINWGLSEEPALAQWKLPELILNGVEKYPNLENVWENQKLGTFRFFVTIAHL